MCVCVCVYVCVCVREREREIDRERERERRGERDRERESVHHMWVIRTRINRTMRLHFLKIPVNNLQYVLFVVVTLSHMCCEFSGNLTPMTSYVLTARNVHCDKSTCMGLLASFACRHMLVIPRVMAALHPGFAVQACH